MAFYNTGYNDEIIEIIIRDSTGRKIDKFRFKVGDKFLAQKILSTLMEKYAILDFKDFER